MPMIVPVFRRNEAKYDCQNLARDFGGAVADSIHPRLAADRQMLLAPQFGALQRCTLTNAARPYSYGLSGGTLKCYVWAVRSCAACDIVMLVQPLRPSSSLLVLHMARVFVNRVPVGRRRTRQRRATVSSVLQLCMVAQMQPVRERIMMVSLLCNCEPLWFFLHSVA